MVKYEETKYGFNYGSSKVTRLFSDDKTESITLGVQTPKFSGNKGLQIYVTRTGKVRIFDYRGEWSAPKS